MNAADACEVVVMGWPKAVAVVAGWIAIAAIAWAVAWLFKNKGL